MTRFGVLLFNVLIALGLIVSGLLVHTQIATGTSDGRDKSHPVDTAAPSIKRDRDTDERERPEKRVDRNGSVGGEEPAFAQTEDTDDPCADLKPIKVRGRDFCTHGPDPAPPDLDISTSVRALAASAAGREVAAVACDGDGQSGNRVQVLYVRGSDVSSRYSQFLASIRGWAADASQIFQASAEDTGGSRGLRFVQDATCQPAVQEVVVSPAGDGDFNATIDELQSLGYKRTDRIYLMFVDTTAAGICGIGTLWNDDRPTSDNINNSGPGYARVDAGCWRGHVAAHELMHTFGGVQDSAPHASLGGHCIDEYDVMCYSDWPYFPQVQFDCLSSVLNTTRFDCGHDDYFHTNPPAGSYLATHWNPANNQFLTNAAPISPPPPPQPPQPPPPPPPPPSDETVSPPKKQKKEKGKKGKHKKSKHKKGNRK